jgi:hypothetical protein
MNHRATLPPAAAKFGRLVFLGAGLALVASRSQGAGSSDSDQANVSTPAKEASRPYLAVVGPPPLRFDEDEAPAPPPPENFPPRN